MKKSQNTLRTFFFILSIPHSKKQRFCDVNQIWCIIELSFICKWKRVPVYMFSCLLFYYAIPEQSNTLIRLSTLQRTTFPQTAAPSFFNYRANTFKGSRSLNIGARPFCALLNNSPWYFAHLFSICDYKCFWNKNLQSKTWAKFNSFQNINFYLVCQGVYCKKLKKLKLGGQHSKYLYQRFITEYHLLRAVSDILAGMEYP